MGHAAQKLLIFGMFTLVTTIYHPVSAADCSQLYAKPCLAKLPYPTQVPVVSYDGDDSIYIFGGARWYLTGPAVYSNEILKYTISTDAIQLVALLPIGLYLGTVTADGLGNYFYFGGAYPGGNSHYVFKFNSYTNQVTQVTRIPFYFHYSASFAYDQSTAFIMSGNLFQNGVVKFSMDNYGWSQMADLPTQFSQAVTFWDKKTERAYLFGKGNALVNPPYDHVVYQPGPDYSQIHPLDLPDNYLDVAAVSNDEYNGYIVGGFKETGSLFWYRLDTGDGQYCPVWGLPGGGDILFSRTGIALVPNLKRIYVFGGATQSLTSPWLQTTYDDIWFIEV
ncbi:hypothetical protein Fcan01_16895 [Folsomia candida]|uniref:Uncharacterized protein n=1 Tax=Folsomia candida TaxID=158441 RepID=A0A226DRA7_FOLCA|nr:hypothetical protein Fcan01_16895 [Folsomia candida]